MTRNVQPINHNHPDRITQYPLPFQRPWREAARILTRRLLLLLASFWVVLTSITLIVFYTIFPQIRLAFTTQTAIVAATAAIVLLIGLICFISYLVWRLLFTNRGPYIASTLLIVLTFVFLTITITQEERIRTTSGYLWDRLENIDTPPEIAIAETPTSTATATPINTTTPTATDTPQPPATITIAPPILIPSNTPIPLPPTPTPTDTPITALPTATSTDTTLPPSPTPVPITPTDIPSPTNTQAAPSTFTPTSVDTPTPINTPGPAPAISNLTGSIAYTRFNGDNPGVYVYGIRNNTHTLLIPLAQQPDMNAAGSTLAHSGNGAIIRISLNGANLRAITRQANDAHPHWSPDGSMVVYSTTDSANPSPRIRLQTNPSTAEDGTPLLGPSGASLRGNFPLYLAGGLIAFYGCNSWKVELSGECGIYTLNLADANAVRVTTNTSDIPNDNLGSQILYMTRSDGSWDIFIVNPGGEGPRPVVTGPANDGLATVSPDGQFVAFLSDRNGGWAIYVVALTGGEPSKLFDLPTNAIAGADWTKDNLSWSIAE